MLALMRCEWRIHADAAIPSLQHPYRNDFQRDRDRVIHSRSFRRLEAKTQVFSTAAIQTISAIA